MSSQQPIKLIITGWLLGMTLALGCATLFIPYYQKIDFYDAEIALILGVSTLLSFFATILANWFWCKIPLTLSASRNLSLWIAFSIPLIALLHPEMGMNAFLIWNVKPGNLIFSALLANALFVTYLAPWFTRRFFYESLD
jgi:hypothetical protein